MSTTTTTLLLLLSVALLYCAQICGAWGPIYHQYISSFHLPECHGDASKLNACFAASMAANASTYSYLLGGSSPDSLKNVSLRLHSLEFASVALQFIESGQWQPSPQPGASFDARAFVLAFGGHVCQDFVGHYANGYLNPKFDHPIEFAVDTRTYHALGFRQQFKLAFPVHVYTAEAQRFAFEAQQYFAQWTEAHTPASVYRAAPVDAVQAATRAFDAQALAESVAVLPNILWPQQLVAWNYCNSTISLDVATRQLEYSTDMGREATEAWIKLATAPQASAAPEPQQMDKAMRAFVDDQYSRIGGTICSIK